jgi:hypothetical protein
LNEVFIRKAKYIQYWGTDRDLFSQIMMKYNLDEVKDLNFVDEYPMVTESLINASTTSEIIADLKNSFRFRLK